MYGLFRPRPSAAVVPAAAAYATSVSSPSRSSFRSATLPPLTVRVAAVRYIERASGLFRHVSRIRSRNDAPDVDTSRSSTVTVSKRTPSISMPWPRVEHQRDVRPGALPRERAQRLGQLHRSASSSRVTSIPGVVVRVRQPEGMPLLGRTAVLTDRFPVVLLHPRDRCCT